MTKRSGYVPFFSTILDFFDHTKRGPSTTFYELLAGVFENMTPGPLWGKMGGYETDILKLSQPTMFAANRQTLRLVLHGKALKRLG